MGPPANSWSRLSRRKRSPTRLGTGTSGCLVGIRTGREQGRRIAFARRSFSELPAGGVVKSTCHSLTQWTPPTGHGLGDFSAAIKYRLRAPKRRLPTIVLGLESTFPTGDSSKGTGEGVYELRPNLAFLQKIGRTTLQGNLGYAVALAKGTAEESNQGTFNASAVFPLCTNQWYLLAEATGTFATNSRQMLLAPGIKYTFGHNRFLALGLPEGVTANSPAFGVIVQMQFSIREHGEHEQARRAID